MVFKKKKNKSKQKYEQTKTGKYGYVAGIVGALIGKTKSYMKRCWRETLAKSVLYTVWEAGVFCLQI